MLADMYDCQVKTVAQTEGPALGAAILAGVGCGIFESVESACDALIFQDKTTGPEERQAGLYKKYHLLYKQLYEDLKDSYKKLAAL